MPQTLNDRLGRLFFYFFESLLFCMLISPPAHPLAQWRSSIFYTG